MNKYNKIYVITPAKVGSGSIYNSLNNANKSVVWGHSLNCLKSVLREENNILIVTGIRNPIARNLSYFFQTYTDNFYNEVKTNKNNYRGEYCINNKLVNCKDYKIFIEEFKKFEYLFSYIDWLTEFIDLTNISNFDKQKGYQLYNLSKNNKILVYTLEKLDTNKNDICNILDIKEIKNSNQSKDKGYQSIYQQVKKNIVYDNKYINKLVSNNIFNLFYDKDTLNTFKNDVSYI